MRVSSLLLTLALTACGSRVDFQDKSGDTDTGVPDGADADTDTDADTDSDTDADTDSDTDADTDSDTDTDTGEPTPSPWDSATAADLDGIGGPALVTLMNLRAFGDTLVANGSAGYVWISTDAGVTWDSAYSADFAYTADGVAVTSDGIFVAGYAGIFHSTDDGLTWTNETAGLGGALAMVLATDGTELYAETTYGERIFHWNGAGWDEVTAPVMYSTPLAVDGDTLYTGDFGGNVYRSDDGGLSWITTGGGSGPDTILQSSIAAGDLLGWATMEGTLKRSTDGGVTWSPLASMPSNPEGFVQAPDGTLYARVYMNGVYASTDDGETWSNIGRGLPSGWGRWVQGLAVNEAGDVFAAPYQAGLFVWNGATWDDSSDDIVAGSATDAVMYDGKLLTTWGNDVPWAYDYATDTWTEIDSPASGSAMLGMLETDGEVIIVSSAYYGLYRTDDGGSSWENANTGLPNAIGDAGLEALNVYDLAFHGDTVVAAHSIVYEGSHEGTRTPSGGGVSISDDRGQSWHWSCSGLPRVATDDNGQPVYPSSSAALATDEVYLLATVGSGIYRSTNSGSSWSAGGGVEGDTLVTDLVAVGTTLYASGQDVNSPLASGGNGLWRSDDAGVTWVTDEAGLPADARITALATTGATLYALVDAPTQGIWRLDAGTWSLVAEPAPDADYTLQAPLVLEGDAFYVSTQGAGMLRLVPIE